MKKIDISTAKHRNRFALVDDDDYERLNRHKWNTLTRFGTTYARRTIRDHMSKSNKTILMHRAIMDLTGKDEMVDHRDMNGLNNQRANLRICCRAGNSMNRCKPANNTSGYKGVSWQKQCDRWGASIRYKKKSIYLGHFFCIIKAAKEYDKKATELFGEFARTNFERKVR